MGGGRANGVICCKEGGALLPSAGGNPDMCVCVSKALYCRQEREILLASSKGHCGQQGNAQLSGTPDAWVRSRAWAVLVRLGARTPGFHPQI